jgi:hypothetical protein
VLDKKVFAKSHLMIEGLKGIAQTRQAEAQESIRTAAELNQEVEALAQDVRA